MRSCFCFMCMVRVFFVVFSQVVDRFPKFRSSCENDTSENAKRVANLPGRAERVWPHLINNN